MESISGGNFRPLKVDDWIDFVVNHEEFRHYASLAERPGNLVLMTAVEYYLFRPETPANENFHANIVNWGQAIWSVFSVPQERHADIVRTAAELSMRISKNPPAMMFSGASAMVIAVPPTADEEDIKVLLRRHGVPKDFVSAFTGLEMFPGAILNTTHAIENDDRMLTAPLKQEELPAIRKRELQITEALEHGVRPSLADVAAYIYGAGRVRRRPGPT